MQETVTRADSPGRSAFPIWHAILAGDYSLSLADLQQDHAISAEEKQRLRAALLRDYLEPLQQQLTGAIKPLLEQHNYRGAYSAFARAIESSRIAPRVYLAVELIAGATEWLTTLASLGVELQLLSGRVGSISGHEQRLAFLLEQTALPLSEHEILAAAEFHNASPFLVPLIDFEARKASESLPATERQKLGELFIKKIDAVNRAVFGPYRATTDGEIALAETAFMKKVRSGDYNQALALLKEAVRESGLHIRAGGMAAVLGRRGFDWCQQLILVGHALNARDQESVFKNSQAALAIGRQARLPQGQGA